MTNFKEFIMNDVDYVLVVNKEFEVVYSSRFDTRMGETKSSLTKYHSFFELYPEMKQKNSSIIRTMVSA